MRVIRPLVLSVLIAGGFLYYTTYRNGRLHPANGVSLPAKVEITEAAGGDPFDAE